MTGTTKLPPTALQRAIAWLRAVLSNGPLEAKEVQRMAEEAGIGRKTLKRARAKLGVRSSPAGYQGPRMLSLPEEVTGSEVPSLEPVDDSVGPPEPVPASAVTSEVPRVEQRRPRPVPERPAVRRIRLRRVVRQPSTRDEP